MTSLGLGSTVATLQQNLVSGSSIKALGSLYVISSAVIVPLTYIRQAYSFSVGYGLSVAAMSWMMLSSFGDGLRLDRLKSSVPSILAMTTLVYGVRLAAYIFLREQTVESKKKVFIEMDKTPVLKRTPLALSVALFYSLLVSPTLFAFRAGSLEAGTLKSTQLGFTGLAIFGTLLEAIADQHKYEAKRNATEGEDTFVGPTTWSYKLCRHPNYFGEITHWAGIFAAGAVTFGKAITPWISGVLGLYGIFSIMSMAAKRLDDKQAEKYSGQSKYDEYKAKVTASLIPFVK